jgi:hypothetical protein
MLSGTSVPGLRGRRLKPARRRALASAWRAFWISRLLVWSSGMIGVAVTGAGAYRRLVPGAGDPADTVSGLLLSPARRWDSGWFLSIAQSGYDVPQPRTSFFPLYPLLIRVIGEPIDAVGLVDPHAFELAGVLVSLVAFLVALYLLHRLTDVELGPQAADNAVALLALFPTAFFFSAIYSESLFLALTVGCVYSARMGWWWRAAVVGALASATRAQGVLLLLPLAIMLLHGPKRRAVALAVVPVGLAAYLAFIRLTTGYGFLAPIKSHEEWSREFHGPIVGVWEGIKSGAAAARDLLSGAPLNAPVSGVRSGLQNLAALGFGVVGVAGALRRLPIAYGAYALLGLIFAVSFPLDAEPLKSLPRLVIVLFPIFMWGGWAMTGWGHRNVILATSAAGLASFSVAFACGYWIA